MSIDIQRSIQYQKKINLDTTNSLFQSTFADLAKNYSNIFAGVELMKKISNKQQETTDKLIIEHHKFQNDLNTKQESLPIGNRGDELVATKSKKWVTHGKDNYIFLSNPEMGVVSLTKSEVVENKKVFTTTNVELYPSKPKKGGVLTTNGDCIEWSNQNALIFDLPTYDEALVKGQLYRDGDFVKIK